MLPESCKNDIIRVLNEQQSKKNLFISDNLPESNELFSELKKNFDNMYCYHGEDITEMWDTILISNAYMIREDCFIVILRELLQYVKCSILVVSPMFLDENAMPVKVQGISYMYPTRYASIDFTYKSYEENITYVLYNFYSAREELEVSAERSIERTDNKRKLTVLYPLPHLKLTGGLKCLLAHARFLHRRGHKVYLVYNGIENAIPAWSDLIEGEDVTGQIYGRNSEEIITDILNKEIDVIVLGVQAQIKQFIGLKIPMMYWEQGDKFLFGDIKKVCAYNDLYLENLRKIYQSPIMIASNSDFLGEILKARFGRITPLLYTGIDTDFYHPADVKVSDENVMPRILLVGHPFLAFKNFSFLLTALVYVYAKGYRFTVTWACQKEPEVTVNFPLTYRVAVSQSELAELYRTHDIYINTSIYEAFGMPSLEAMASGTAVIATDCGGVRTYAVPGENMLLVEQGNMQDLIACIIYLLENPHARQFLAENGRKTALEFTIDKAVDQLEDILYQTIENYKKA